MPRVERPRQIFFAFSPQQKKEGCKQPSLPVETHKNSEEYKRNPAFADGMMGAWNAIHDDLIAKTAEVKAMVDGFK